MVCYGGCWFMLKLTFCFSPEQQLNSETMLLTEIKKDARLDMQRTVVTT